LQVERAEFLMFILEHLGLVDADELERIMEMVNTADINGDGVLNLQDIKVRLSGRLESSEVDAALLPGTSRSGGGGQASPEALRSRPHDS
jgi:hypothetical protein